MIDLGRAKKHLNIDTDFKDDDPYILTLIKVSENAIAIHLNYKNLYEVAERYGEIPAGVEQAQLLLIGNLYANREPVSYSSAVKVPYTLEYLISLYRNYKDE